jgi:hypothetical protein
MCRHGSSRIPQNPFLDTQLGLIEDCSIDDKNIRYFIVKTKYEVSKLGKNWPTTIYNQHSVYSTQPNEITTASKEIQRTRTSQQQQQHKRSNIRKGGMFKHQPQSKCPNPNDEAANHTFLSI